MYLGNLYFDIFPDKNFNISSLVNVEALLTLIKANISSPRISSGIPTTIAFSIPGCLLRLFSISVGEIFSPPLIITSLSLPFIYK